MSTPSTDPRQTVPAPRGNRTAVLIVGGGITGLSAALFLTRHGVRPILVERHPSTAIMPRARAFNPRSMEIYRALGLAEEIRDRRSMLVDFPEMIGADTLAGEERFRIDLLAQVRPPATLSPTDWGLIDQDELERIVRAHAERGGADVRFGTELVSLENDTSGVRAVVRDLGDGTEYPIQADYLVAADGHRAGIRHRLGVDADGPGVLAQGAHFVFDADLAAVLRGRRFVLAYLDNPTKGTVLVPMKSFGRWMLGVPYDPEVGDRPEDFTERRCVELARLAVGVPDLDVTLVPPSRAGPRRSPPRRCSERGWRTGTGSGGCSSSATRPTSSRPPDRSARAPGSPTRTTWRGSWPATASAGWARASSARTGSSLGAPAPCRLGRSTNSSGR
jgi:putative polyketide hydroxylase